MNILDFKDLIKKGQEERAKRKAYIEEQSKKFFTNENKTYTLEQRVGALEEAIAEIAIKQMEVKNK